MSPRRELPRWPLYLIAAPAAAAVWSGWVGLGGLCGFGVIHPLPGIWDAARLNTAITLPIGVEAYGAYALRAWLTPGISDLARKFAARSAIGSLALGMLGQVVYHLLAAAHMTRAPWPVVTFVSCLPVVALALGSALAHLLHESRPGPDEASGPDELPGPGPARDLRAELAATRAARIEANRAALDGPPAGPVPDEAPAVVPAAASPGGGPTGGPAEPILEEDPGPGPDIAHGPAPEPGPAGPAETPATVPPAGPGPAGEPDRPVPPAVPVMFRAPAGHAGPDADEPGPARSGPHLAALPEPPEPGGPDGPGRAAVPADMLGARRAYAASVKAGSPMSARALAAEYGISRRQAAKITTPGPARREVPA